MSNLKMAEYPELLSDEIIERASKLNQGWEKVAYEAERSATISLYEDKRLKGEELFNLAPQWVLDMLEER
jgi:hypothetical protein